MGLQGYNKYRKLCASGRYGGVQRFEDLTRDGYMSTQTVRKLSALYRDVDDIDLFVGGTLENPHSKALLGPTFLCLIGDQFARFKIADRFESSEFINLKNNVLSFFYHVNPIFKGMQILQNWKNI